MLIPFEQLPGTSRIWIFQSDIELDNKTMGIVLKKAAAFLATWTAHNNELHAGVTVLHNYFLILAVDENRNDASGCSIDKAFRFIRELEKDLNLSWLNRMNVAVMNNGVITILKVNELKNQLERGEYGLTMIFNNLVQQKAELESNWLVPVKESWLAGS